MKRTLPWKLKMTWLWVKIYFTKHMPYMITRNDTFTMRIFFNLDKADYIKLAKAEALLEECGICLDTAWPRGGREWIIGFQNDGKCNVSYVSKKCLAQA